MESVQARSVRPAQVRRARRTPTVRRSVATALSLFAVGTAVVAHLWLQAGMVLGWRGFSLGDFRNYYPGDQLSYLGIAADVAQGHGASVEPFTLTGSIYYPRAYYVLLGELARLTSTAPATWWLVLGLAVQAVLVAVVGGATVALSRRWWTGFVGFTPFVLGTGSRLVGDHGWARTLGSHAVLWGPQGVLFTLNGETVALSLGAICALAFVLIGAGRIRGRSAWLVAVSACLVAGGLASVQTYGFLTTVYVLAGGVAAVGLVRSRSRPAVAVTAGLTVVLALMGPVLATAVSPLATLVVGLSPALPGLVQVLRLTRWRGLWCVGALAVGAAPQVVATALGVLAQDPFLIYRQSSSANLGVPAGPGLWAAAGVLPTLVALAVLGLRRQRVLWTALPLALGAAWLLLASNDHWGANQEPYRLWLDSYVVVAAVLVPLAVWAAVEVFLGGAAGPGPADAPPVAGQSGASVPAGPWRPELVATAAAAAACVLVAGVWSMDFVRFRATVADLGYLALTGPRVTAQAELAAMTDGSLVMTDGCIDPVALKPAWGGPLALYSAGLAWPDPGTKAALDVVLPARGAPSTFDQQAAGRAGIGYLLADPTCELDLRPFIGADLVASRAWEADDGTSGVVELWRLQD